MLKNYLAWDTLTKSSYFSLFHVYILQIIKRDLDCV